MNNDRKRKRMELGAEALAEALLDFSVHSDNADDLIDWKSIKSRGNLKN
jgi:hypothetical protein